MSIFRNAMIDTAADLMTSGDLPYLEHLTDTVFQSQGALSESDYLRGMSELIADLEGDGDKEEIAYRILQRAKQKESRR